MDCSSHQVKSSCNSGKKLRFYCLFIAITALLFQSCQLEPNPTGDKVEVQLLDNQGFPVYSLSLMGVCIGSNAIVSPDGMGYCSFENVQFPYDLNIIRWGSIPYTYKNIYARSLHLSIFSEHLSNYNECLVRVKFPPIEYGKIGYVRFISRDLFEQDHGYWHFVEGGAEDTTYLNLQIPRDKNSITGKLLFFKCKEFWDGPSIYSFDNYGIKDVTFHSGLNDMIVFSLQEITFNPNEYTVNVNITHPADYYYSELKFVLSFPGYNKNSDIVIGDYFNSNITWQIVPSSLNIPFIVKAESNYRYTTLSLPFPKKVIEAHPDNLNNILHNKITLLNPQNHEEGINSNSQLKAEETGEKGIYVFSIAKDSIKHTKVNIITDKSSITLGEISSSNFILSPNTNYAWRVGKLSSFNSIDQFVSEPYVFQENFNSIEFSDVWYFKTAP
jgi:hypothetical protein